MSGDALKVEQLRPGGVYALQVGEPLSIEQIERIRADLRDQLPSNCKVLIFDGGLEITPLAELLMGATIG